jgi:hypothetical protein
MVRVVEPREYAPSSHADIFRSIINELVSPVQSMLTGYANNQLHLPKPFDLLLFPEAFAPATSLVDALRSLQGTAELGCVHVGLRPSADTVLFRVAEITTLIEQIESLPCVAADDLRPFKEWLEHQDYSSMFNLGCVFAVDLEQKVRVCLHPKVVPSQFEASALPDRCMTGANLLTLVTLHSTNKTFLSITIQPLICSDALSLRTDSGNGSPLEELQLNANIFEFLPDHIDIVSLATCTPQKPDRSANGIAYREWHNDFRDTFIKAAQDGRLSRHHFASFALSNFLNLPNGKEGGLSGVFEPVRPKVELPLKAIKISCFGFHRTQPGETEPNNRWSTPDDEPLVKWTNRGYIASLDPDADPKDAVAKIFGFSLPSIGRDCSPWKPRGSVTNCEITLAHWGEDGSLIFKTMESRA